MPRLPLRTLLLVGCLGLLALVFPYATRADGPASDELSASLKAMTHYLDEMDEALTRGDVTAARREYNELNEQWEMIEDDARAAAPDAYVEIEDRLHALRDAFAAQPPAAERIRAAAQALDHELDEVGAKLDQTSAPLARPAASDGPASLAPLLGYLDRAANEARAGDTAQAAAAMREFRRAWPGLETLVATRSAHAYEAVEEGMSKAYALLTATPPDTEAALAVIGAMQSELQPLTAPARYGVADAAIIMLREGLEALLIIGALLAFLKKSSNADKQRWVWLGGLAGVVASIGAAIALQRVFVSATAGANREIIEGVVGLVAAGLLVYVSYWLHRSSHLGAWQQYIRQQSGAALAQNSLFSLASIAFLAVFREGAETVVFYMGIAPSIALADLALGVGLAVLVLVVLGALILRFGVRIPLRPFFLVTSLLLYYMAFKFVGAGIHALQVAGAIPATPSRFLPAWQFLGLFPTLETTLAQLLLLGLAVVVVLILRRQTTVLTRS